jgi:hypothetical protein
MVVVGQALVDLIKSCPQNPGFMEYSVMAGDLKNAVDFVSRASGTSDIILFDGAVGGFNLTAPLADLLRAKASTVEEEVESNLLPKWCEQRGLKMGK